MYTDKFDTIFDEYNNTYYRTIKMKLVNVESSEHIDCDVWYNHKYSKFYVGDYSKPARKNFYYCKSIAPRIYLTNVLNGEEIAGALHEKELQNAKETEFRTEKVRKKKT